MVNESILFKNYKFLLKKYLTSRILIMSLNSIFFYFNSFGSYTPSIQGLIHHSDQGAQYASTEYVNTLKDHGIQISMSRKGNPYDNAFTESFIKTLKYEEVYLNEYDNISEAGENIGGFIEIVYNKKRLHSSLGYKSPEAFEMEEKTKKLT